jgi:release factor glutamine methyltransferase
MRIESQTTSHASQLLDVRAALKEGIARLREAGTPSHTLAAELLLIHVLGRDRTWLYAHPEAALDSASVQHYLALIARRAAGEPTQYLTGKQEFWGLEFEVTPDVLIPRPETEHVIEVALERMGSTAREAKLRIADVGTGSGCLAIALAKEFPHAEIFATDISEPALAVARRNAGRHGLISRVSFTRCDLLEKLSDDLQVTVRETILFDLIVSNPPYIALTEAAALPREIREHEPEQALFAGQRGFEVYPALVAQAEIRLKSGGVLVLELGHDSLTAVRSILSPAAWRDIRVTNDLAGIPRVIAATRA